MKSIRTPFLKDTIAALRKSGSHDLVTALEGMMRRQLPIQPEDLGIGKTVYSLTAIDLPDGVVEQIKDALRRADQRGQQQGEYDPTPSRALMGWDSVK